MSLTQLIYASQPFGFDAGRLDDILLKSRANNVRDGITGALICRADLYLQLLEGPPDKVAAAFDRINADDRHCDIILMQSRTVNARRFPGWAMRDDPAQSWMWSPDEIAAGVLRSVQGDDVLAVFDRLARDC
jgi:Sensors of blue-light using FAD